MRDIGIGSRFVGSLPKPARAGACMAIALGFLLAQAFGADQRTQLKPGWNLFSPEQDVEIGRQTSAEAEKQLPMLGKARVDDYLNRLGHRLAAKAPGAEYPYQFKAVNDMSINAFALPGGFLYINRGTIEAADDEAQLAGVIGHEIGHVALRHGTNQASKAYAYKAPLAILGGIVGTDSIGGILAQIGAGFAVDSVLLKYSRDAERQADLMGTQILYDEGYDPRAMAQFFEKLQAEGGNRAPDFFSSHPNPENRMQKIMEEIDRLGGSVRNTKRDSAEFREIKSYVQSLPPPPKAEGASGAGDERATPRGLEPPSSTLRTYQDDSLRLRHPDNWYVFGQDGGLMLAPKGGLVDLGGGNTALAYGMMIGSTDPGNGKSGRLSLEEATQHLIDNLKNANPGIRATGGSAATRVAGERALVTMMRNDSPLGGIETNWLVTVLRSGKLFYFVGVAPEQDFNVYKGAFEKVQGSVRFVNR